MSGLAIRIELADTGAAAALAGLKAVSADLRPLLQDIGAELEMSTVERFDSNVGPDGVPWPQSIRAREKGGKTLVDRAYLRDSVAYRLDGAAAVEVGAGGIAGEYAAIHQTGGTIRAKTAKGLRFRLASGNGPMVTVQSVRIPPRPYLGLSAEDNQAVEDLAVDRWRQALAGRP